MNVKNSVGAMLGIMTWKSVPILPAPSIFAASSISPCTPESAVSMSITFSPPYFHRNMRSRDENGAKSAK